FVGWPETEYGKKVQVAAFSFCGRRCCIACGVLRFVFTAPRGSGKVSASYTCSLRGFHRMVHFGTRSAGAYFEKTVCDPSQTRSAFVFSRSTSSSNDSSPNKRQDS